MLIISISDLNTSANMERLRQMHCVLLMALLTSNFNLQSLSVFFVIQVITTCLIARAKAKAIMCAGL